MATSDVVLHLFGGPYVELAGHRRDIPEGSKRLVAFVALQRPRVERRHLAGILWPDVSESRAAGNLRSALWRLRGAGVEILHGDKWSLALRDDAVVDVEEADGWAERLIGGRERPDDLFLMPWCTSALDLLPGWYDDWVLVARERLTQRMLHALEALSRGLAGVGRHAEAIEVAMLAAAGDPLRESGQRALMEAHIAEGNHVVAWRVYARYRDLLRDELGAAPSSDLAALLCPPPSVPTRRQGDPVSGLPVA